MLPEPFREIPLRRVLASAGGAPFRAGQRFMTTIQNGPAGLELRLGGHRVPLADPGPLAAGQAVLVEIAAREDGLALRITPRTPARTAPMPAALAESAGLRAGQSFTALLQNTGGTRFVEVNGARLPLPAAQDLGPGTHVRVEVRASGQGFTLRISPEPTASAPPQGAPPSPRPEAAQLPSVTRLPLPEALRGLLLPGETIRAEALPGPGGATLQIGSLRAPIGVPLPAGQPVPVDLLLEPGAAREELRILWRPEAAALPHPSGQTPGAGQPAAWLDRVIDAALAALGRGVRHDDAAALLPRQLPRTDAAVRVLMTVFAAREALGADLAAIGRMLDAAARDGALPEARHARFAAAHAAYQAESAREFEGLLRHLAGEGRPEARLAAALRGGLANTLRAMTAQVRHEIARLHAGGELEPWLRETQQAQRFAETAGRVLERFASGDLQQLRSLELPYLFLELPMPPGHALERAQIHVLADAGGGKKRFDENNATIALDLETGNLGRLWILLRFLRGHCVCRMLATEPAAVSALRQGADALAEALADAGYPGARVEAGLWHGARAAAAAALLRRYAGMSAQA